MPASLLSTVSSQLIGLWTASGGNKQHTTQAASNRDTTTTKDPHGFPQFSRLPVEVRLIIWRHAIPRRTVHVELSVAGSESPPSPHRLRSSHGSLSLPSVAHVNQEARHETLRWYLDQPLPVDRARVLWAFWLLGEHFRPNPLLPNLSGSHRRQESDVRRMPDPGLDVRPFHPETDVLEWTSFHPDPDLIDFYRENGDLNRQQPRILSAFIIGTGLSSVRHVSVSFRTGQLELLAFAVADPSHPLQTLTVDVCQLYQFRVTRQPSEPKYLPDRSLGRSCGDDLQDALTRDRALFFPRFARPADSTEDPFLQRFPSGKRFEALLDMAERQSIEDIKQTYPVLDRRCAIFLIIRREHLLHPGRHVPSLYKRHEAALNPYHPFLPDVPAGLWAFGFHMGGPWEFNHDLAVDILLWTSELRGVERCNLREPLNAHHARERLFRAVPFHGVCVSDFGLPDGGSDDDDDDDDTNVAATMSDAMASNFPGRRGLAATSSPLSSSAVPSWDAWGSRNWHPDRFVAEIEDEPPAVYHRSPTNRLRRAAAS